MPASLWKKKTLRDKGSLKDWALSGRSQFETLLDMLHGVNPKPYDIIGDPKGELLWRDLQYVVAVRDPLKIDQPAQHDMPAICTVAEAIIAQFRHLIEERRYSEDLYDNNEPKPESGSAEIIFRRCLQLLQGKQPRYHARGRNGAWAGGFQIRLGVHRPGVGRIKPSTNKQIVHGYTRQLEAYKSGEETVMAYYVVIDVGGMGKKDQALIKERNAVQARGERASPIVFIDGGRKLSASKL